MPMHRERLAERGENPTEVMARTLRRQLPGRPPLIIATRTRLTARQQGLDRGGRLANVAGSVRIDSDLPTAECCWSTMC
jgi:predicted amidophosphoribosyltransferase